MKENKNYNPLENNTNVLPNVTPKPADKTKADKTKAASDKTKTDDKSKSSTADASKKPAAKAAWQK